MNMSCPITNKSMPIVRIDSLYIKIFLRSLMNCKAYILTNSCTVQ